MPQSPDKHPLLDDEVREKLPSLYSQEALGLMALATIKFFTPDAGATWYATEASARLTDDTYVPLKDITPDDPRLDDVIFFGLADILEAELGYFSLNELESVRGRLGLPVERDLHFQPKTLKELKDLHERGEVG
jgi:hypothetical protein